MGPRKLYLAEAAWRRNCPVSSKIPLVTQVQQRSRSTSTWCKISQGKDHSVLQPGCQTGPGENQFATNHDWPIRTTAFQNGLHWQSRDTAVGRPCCVSISLTCISLVCPALLDFMHGAGTGVFGWLLHSKTFLIRFVHLSEAVMCPACLRGFDRWP